MTTIIAADIGGTNCRLGLFRVEDGVLDLVRARWIKTESVTCADEFIAATAAEFDIESASALVAAIAGPVEANIRGQLTNGSLVLDLEPHQPLHKSLRLCVLNDFMAQAWAIISPLGLKSRQICGPEGASLQATRAVLGAGTGFGYASIPLVDGKWIPVPSENGHVVFPFLTKEELDFGKFLCEKLDIPYATADDAVTGRGLAILHEFLTGDALEPAEVGNTFLSCESETLQWYSRFYGRSCRNWILTTMCAGGMWIAGGIAAQNPLTVTCATFQEELEGGRQWSDFIKSVPIRLIEDVNSGLWGAAYMGWVLTGKKDS